MTGDPRDVRDAGDGLTLELYGGDKLAMCYGRGNRRSG
jgi:hypothetical protein